MGLVNPPGGSPIKTITRGQRVIASIVPGGSIDVIISSVDLNKSIVTTRFVRGDGSGSQFVLGCAAHLLNTNTLRIYPPDPPGSGWVYEWEIVSYV